MFMRHHFLRFAGRSNFINSDKIYQREQWRILHYGTYLVIFLSLIHSLFISGEFIEEEELIDFEEPEKVILLILLVIALSIPIWRLFLAKKYLAKKEAV